MTATERLLASLKENGTEHYEHEAPAAECVAFFDGERWHDCWESVDGEVNVTFSMTPEQAIAATLGPCSRSCNCTDGGRTDGTCRVDCFDDGVDEGLDGEWFSYAPPTWYLSCGHEVYDSECPRFCPVCGREVVDE